jgi:hypothetical protein
MEQDYLYPRRMKQFVDSRSQGEQAIHQERDANEKPDGNPSASSHNASPENDIHDHERRPHNYRPEPWPVNMFWTPQLRSFWRQMRAPPWQINDGRGYRIWSAMAFIISATASHLLLGI